MRKIGYCIFSIFLLTIAMISFAQSYNKDVTMDTIQNHLKADNRLAAADKKINFIQAFENEIVDKDEVISCPDISQGKLILDKNMVFDVSQTQAPREILDESKQKIGWKQIFLFVDTLDDNKEKKKLRLNISTYHGVEGYDYARDQFILSLRSTSMSYIPFEKGPSGLGAVSIKKGAIFPTGRIVWIYHNAVFELSNTYLSEDVVLKIAHWVQKSCNINL